ncbi:LLM class flavin-dependent oxidoreductase [Nonomuraea cavernae]|uniref:LLM class flavin-dependent oxidoreductase n=1 Tax=Nonomuraea cavernae TaxID=2045107 RepID=UPI0033CFD217
MAKLSISAIASDGAEWIAFCKEGEKTGLEAAWAADTFGRDCFVDAGLALSHTETLKVGVAIALPTRTPLQTARAVQSLGEWGHRFTLGLGPGHTAQEGAVSERFHRLVGAGDMENAHGIPFFPPATRMKEYQECITTLLYTPLDEPVDIVREHYRASGKGFGYQRADIPTMFGAFGDRMVRMSGEVADGVILHHIAPRAELLRKSAMAREAHERSGSTAPFKVSFGTITAVHEDEGEALRLARADLVGAFAVPLYLDRLAAAHPDVVSTLKPLLAAEKYTEAAAALSEDVVRELIVVSTPERLRDEIESFGDGVDECILLPSGVFSFMVAAELDVRPPDLVEARDAMLRGIFGGIPTASKKAV